MKKTILIAAGIAMSSIIFSACNNSATQENSVSSEQTVSEETYQCPMKCEGDKTYDKMGQCPKCNMDLAKIESNHSMESHEGHQH